MENIVNAIEVRLQLQSICHLPNPLNNPVWSNIPDENQSTKDNSDSGGCETLETPNIFLFTSVLSFITILIRSCFYFRKNYSPSQSRSYFI